MYQPINPPYDTEAVALLNARVADNYHIIASIPLMMIVVLLAIGVAIMGHNAIHSR